MIGGDDRPPHCLGLNDHAPEPLWVARGGNDDIGQHICSRHIPAFADDAKEGGDPKSRCSSVEFLSKAAVLL